MILTSSVFFSSGELFFLGFVLPAAPGLKGDPLLLSSAGSFLPVLPL